MEPCKGKTCSRDSPSRWPNGSSEPTTRGRGGISIALALSLPESEERSILLVLTYCIVVFSLLVQGLAWMEERTERLVETALAMGFRGIDTANQRRHYDEAGVGAALRTVLDRGEIPHGELSKQRRGRSSQARVRGQS